MPRSASFVALTALVLAAAIGPAMADTSAAPSAEHGVQSAAPSHPVQPALPPRGGSIQGHLPPDLGTAVVGGRVIGDTGAPLEGATVRALARSRFDGRTVITDAEGPYELRGLPAMSITIAASLPGHTGATEGLEALRLVTLREDEVRKGADLVLVRADPSLAASPVPTASHWPAPRSASCRNGGCLSTAGVCRPASPTSVTTAGSTACTACRRATTICRSPRRTPTPRMRRQQRPTRAARCQCSTRACARRRRRTREGACRIGNPSGRDGRLVGAPRRLGKGHRRRSAARPAAARGSAWAFSGPEGGLGGDVCRSPWRRRSVPFRRRAAWPLHPVGHRRGCRGTARAPLGGIRRERGRERSSN